MVKVMGKAREVHDYVVMLDDETVMTINSKDAALGLQRLFDRTHNAALDSAADIVKQSEWWGNVREVPEIGSLLTMLVNQIEGKKVPLTTKLEPVPEHLRSKMEW